MIRHDALPAVSRHLLLGRHIIIINQTAAQDSSTPPQDFISTRSQPHPFGLSGNAQYLVAVSYMTNVLPH